ncbi:hypothetical protein EI555_019184 [Monodon monoceros]|uniref:TMEM248/TMEM219 domain-containing protein n=1 Tax=Monodon monoceros TaxID=40151 RepID=A0A4V5PAR0_MONMO|nr:hypothetical protein EI555_019184 [Monodon monoceros]
MGSCQAGHNLHLCLAHHPPLVCATLILLLLGLSGLGLGGFLLTHKTGLRSPDIPQDWVSFLRSFGQLTLCPMNGTVKGKWRGSHVVGLLTTLNFGDDQDRNKTQTFQAQVQGSRMGLKGETKEDCEEELALCGSRLLILGSFLLLFCGLLCCLTAVCFHPRRESHWSRTRF